MVEITQPYPLVTQEVLIFSNRNVLRGRSEQVYNLQ